MVGPVFYELLVFFRAPPQGALNHRIRDLLYYFFSAAFLHRLLEFLLKFAFSQQTDDEFTREGSKTCQCNTEI